MKTTTTVRLLLLALVALVGAGSIRAAVFHTGWAGPATAQSSGWGQSFTPNVGADKTSIELPLTYNLVSFEAVTASFVTQWAEPMYAKVYDLTGYPDPEPSLFVQPFFAGVSTQAVNLNTAGFGVPVTWYFNKLLLRKDHVYSVVFSPDPGPNGLTREVSFKSNGSGNPDTYQGGRFIQGIGSTQADAQFTVTMEYVPLPNFTFPGLSSGYTTGKSLATGANGYLFLDPALARVGTAATYEFWVRKNNVPQDDSAILLGTEKNSNERWQIRLDRANPNLWVIDTAGIDEANNYFAVGGDLSDNRWHHIAVTAEDSVLKIYHDGIMVRQTTVLRGAKPLSYPGSYPLAVGMHPFGGSAHFKGFFDELRIWSRARTAEEIGQSARERTMRYGNEPGLVAYFQFEEGVATQVINGVAASAYRPVQVLGSVTRIVDTNLTFKAPAPDLFPVKAAAGLWYGSVTLSQVSQAGAANPKELQPTADSLSMPILLHVDTNGNVRLLKEVTFMQKPNVASNQTSLVLVTDDRLLGNFDGIVKRNGKLIGQRLGSAFYDFDPPQGSDGDSSLPMVGGIASGNALGVIATVSKNHVTNPFRHKYHPDHAQGIDIIRIITVVWDRAADSVNTPNSGYQKISGNYREELEGVHKTTLIAEGRINLQRISLVSRLNDK